jgi:hypothetical protein
MHTCTLNIPSLPPGAYAAHIITGLALHSLLSVVTMCNAGCTITFTKIGCTIVHCGQSIVCGCKCTLTGLWMSPLTPWSLSAPTALSTINLPFIAMAASVDATSSAAKYAHYVHQLLCPHLAATLLHALTTSTELTNIPGLTPALICSHLPRSTATNKGNMCCHRLRTALTCFNHADIVLAQAKVNRMCPPHKAARSRICFALPPLLMPHLAQCTLTSLVLFLFSLSRTCNVLHTSTTLIQSSCDQCHPAPTPC